MPKGAAGSVLHVNFTGKNLKLFQKLEQKVKLLLSLQFYYHLRLEKDTMRLKKYPQATSFKNMAENIPISPKYWAHLFLLPLSSDLSERTL